MQEVRQLASKLFANSEKLGEPVDLLLPRGRQAGGRSAAVGRVQVQWVLVQPRDWACSAKLGSLAAEVAWPGRGRKCRPACPSAAAPAPAPHPGPPSWPALLARPHLPPKLPAPAVQATRSSAWRFGGGAPTPRRAPAWRWRRAPTPRSCTWCRWRACWGRRPPWRSEPQNTCAAVGACLGEHTGWTAWRVGRRAAWRGGPRGWRPAWRRHAKHECHAALSRNGSALVVHSGRSMFSAPAWGPA